MSPFSRSLDHTPLSCCALRICWEFIPFISILSLHTLSFLYHVGIMYSMLCMKRKLTAAKYNFFYFYFLLRKTRISVSLLLYTPHKENSKLNSKGEKLFEDSQHVLASKWLGTKKFPCRELVGTSLLKENILIPTYTLLTAFTCELVVSVSSGMTVLLASDILNWNPSTASNKLCVKSLGTSMETEVPTDGTDGIGKKLKVNRYITCSTSYWKYYGLWNKYHLSLHSNLATTTTSSSVFSSDSKKLKTLPLRISSQR